MASASTIHPYSIPKSVFYDLVKEVVHDQTEEREIEFPNRVSGKAVALLQRTSEEYIATIFERTATPENKILNVDNFQAARMSHDSDEETARLGIDEGEKTILTYDDSTDVLFE